jgi:hypothetical protein
MKIRITNCSMRSHWYFYKVGEVFDVTKERDKDNYYVRHSGEDYDFHVGKEDCEIIESHTGTQAQRIEAICNEVRDLLIRKNHDYGDSFSKQFAKYGVLSGMIRMDDKMRRLETLIGGEEAQVAESVEDSVADLAGYALLTLVELRKSAKR